MNSVEAWFRWDLRALTILIHPSKLLPISGRATFYTRDKKEWLKVTHWPPEDMKGWRGWLVREIGRKR